MSRPSKQSTTPPAESLDQADVSTSERSTTKTGRARSAQMLERSALQRKRILEAASKVIGRHGFAGCSIARVAEKAKVAHGSIYLHFKSQQDLFDATVLESVESLLASIGEATKQASNLLELEEMGFRANVRYLTDHPHLYRMSAEAEVYAPLAYQLHLEKINSRYSTAIRRFLTTEALQDTELETKLVSLAAMLEGARERLYRRYGVKDQKYIGLPEEVMRHYLTFAFSGIQSLFKVVEESDLPQRAKKRSK